MTLGGNVCIRNGLDLDFCFVDSIKSLLPICDVVSVSDGESDDGTQEFLRDWMAKEPKIVLNVYPWESPKGDHDWWVKWLNYNRSHLHTDWHLQLDADEVLHENSYGEILKFIQTPNRSARCIRWNFWKDHRHLIPEGECLAKRVIRLAPQNVWMASDGAHPQGAPCTNMAVDTGIEIAHYGFIRKPEAFFKKEKQLQGFFFDSYDPRLKAAEQDPSWAIRPGITGWENRLDEFHGDHPQIALPWLKERGYDT